MGDREPTHKVNTLSTCTDDLHSREILQITHTRDYLVAWSFGLYGIRLRSQVYDSFFGEFLESHGDTVDDEHRLSSQDGRSIRDDYPDVRGHATGMRPRS